MREFINTRIIEKFMEVNKLSKTQFCKLCGISVSTFDRIINNQNYLLSVLFKVARVLDIEVYMLFE